MSDQKATTETTDATAPFVPDDAYYLKLGKSYWAGSMLPYRRQWRLNKMCDALAMERGVDLSVSHGKAYHDVIMDAVAAEQALFEESQPEPKATGHADVP